MPGSPVGGVGAVRKLGIGPFASLERITEHVPGSRLGYEVVSRQPYRDYRSTVDLTPSGDGTDIVWASSFRPLVPGTGWLLHWALRRIVAGFARNLAKAAEDVAHGDPERDA